jgi:3'(2'), 5'-bisphosphate nucleotidase
MKKLLEIAIEAAIDAGAEIMKIYANDVINSYLTKTVFPIISEENKQLDYVDRKDWETCWMVDPLDGTKEFVKRNGEFTVNIALIKNNKPILGVIYVPVTKTLYYGIVKDQKAYKSALQHHNFKHLDIFNPRDEIKPIQAASNLVKVVGSRSHNNEATATFIKSLEQDGKQVEMVSKGSSLKFCLVAEGTANIYPRYAPTMEWDTAAGHAICNAVGLKVMQVSGKNELQYNKENLLNPYFKVE